MSQALVFIGAVAVMLGMVAFWGFVGTGTARGAWGYLRVWLRVMGYTADVGAALFVVVYAITPSPG